MPFATASPETPAKVTATTSDLFPAPVPETTDSYLARGGAISLCPAVVANGAEFMGAAIRANGLPAAVSAYRAIEWSGDKAAEVWDAGARCSGMHAGPLFKPRCKDTELFFEENPQPGGRKFDTDAERTSDGSVSESRVEAFARHAREQPQLVAKRGVGVDWMSSDAGSVMGRVGLSKRQLETGEALRGAWEALAHASGTGWPKSGSFGPGYPDISGAGTYSDCGRQAGAAIAQDVTDVESFDPRSEGDSPVEGETAEQGADEKWFAPDARISEADARATYWQAFDAIRAKIQGGMREVPNAATREAWSALLAVVTGEANGPVNADAMARALDAVAESHIVAAKRGRGRPKKPHKITVTNADFSNHIYMSDEAAGAALSFT